MKLSLRRCSLLSPIAVCAVLSGPIAAAQASDTTVRATIDSYNSKILKDESKILSAASSYDQTHNSAPLTAALRHEVSDLHSLKGKLAKESASTSKGRKGKDDVVKGLGLIASGYSALAKDVQAASANKPVTKAQLNAAKAADSKGHKLVVAGLKLLV